MILKLLNECISFKSAFFCSSFFLQKSTAYFKIIIVLFFGNVFRLSRNLTFLGFSISRFILVSGKNYSFFKYFSEMNLKLYLAFILILSSFLSLFKLFQYKVFEEIDVMYSGVFPPVYPPEKYNEYICQNESTLCKVFDASKLTYNITNNIILVLANFMIDLWLLKEYFSNLNQKQKITSKKSSGENDDLDNHKHKTVKMVIFNGIIHFISHFPDFVVTILLIYYKKFIKNFCMFNLPCDLINEEAQFFNVFIILSQFFIYKKFNNNFNESFQNIKQRVLKRKCHNFKIFAK
jgi:hypothetical protein